MALTPEEINIIRWKIRALEVEAERSTTRAHYAAEAIRNAERAIDEERALLRLEGVDV